MSFKKVAVLSTATVMAALAANVAPSMTPPGGISVENAPLFVTLGWDDNTDSAGIAWARSLFDGSTNPDGTPAASSFYMNSSTLWYNTSLINAINELAGSNHEMGNHTYDHQAYIALQSDPDKGASSTEGWNGMCLSLRQGTQEMWNEILTHGEDTIASYASSIDMTKFTKGFRSPYLEYGTNLFPALKAKGYRYDCSIEETNSSGSWNWPYTLDNGSAAHNGSWKSNETNEDLGAPSFFAVPNTPGLWEMPAYALAIPTDAECSDYNIPSGLQSRIAAKITWMGDSYFHVTGFDYNLWSEAALDSTEVVGVLKYNLDLRILNNRAPFLFGAHSQYYVGSWAEDNAPNATSAQMRGAIEEFVAYAKSKSMVRLVSTNSVVDWMENPSPLTVSADEAPTNISLSNTTIEEGATTVGTLSSTDVNGGTFTYSIVSGSGFSIDGSTLKADASLTAGEHKVTIKTTDNTDLTFEKEFTVTVTEKVVEGEAVSVFADLSWTIGKDGNGSDGTITATDSKVDVTLNQVDDKVDGDNTVYSWVNASGYIASSLEKVTHVTVKYTSDKDLNLSLGTSTYGYKKALPKGDNQNVKIAIAELEKEWGTAKLDMAEISTIALASTGAGETKFSVTDILLSGFEVVVVEPKDTLELLGNGDLYSYSYDDKEAGFTSTAAIDTGSSSIDFKGATIELADNKEENGEVVYSYAGVGFGNWKDATFPQTEGVKRIEVTYKATVDFAFSVKEAGVSYSMTLPASADFVTANAGTGDLANAEGATGVNMANVDQLDLALAGARSGTIEVTSIKFIYVGDEVAVETPVTKALAVPVFAGLVNGKMNIGVPSNGRYGITMYSLKGQKLGQVSADLKAGMNAVPMSNVSFGRQMMIVQISGNGINAVHKVMAK